MFREINMSGESSDDYFCDEKVNNSTASSLLFVGSVEECRDPADIWEKLDEGDALTNEFLIALLS